MKWRCKEDYPNLAKSDLICVDVETHDPNLLTSGPGAIRRDGFIVGFSIGVEGFNDYYPIRHSEGNVYNVEGTLNWLRDMMALDVPKLGANILYDLVWMEKDLGIHTAGHKYDVQTAEPILNENRFSYSLESLSKAYLGESKVERGLIDGYKYLGLNTLKEEAKIIKYMKGRMKDIPSWFVGEYGAADAEIPLRIFSKQKEKLREQGLWNIFEIETELLDVLLAMWLRGTPIDYDKGEAACEKLQVMYDECVRKIRYKVGFTPNIWAAEDLVKTCDALGLKYMLTEKGAPSFEADWLEQQEHPVFKLILEARQLNRGGSVFIKNKILEASINGRIHPQLWPLKSDSGGTVSGRFACSNPNMQQVPARNPIIAPVVRSVFVPEQGCKWMVADYSQQEPRVTVHYASALKLKNAHIAAEKYRTNPKTDYHQMTADIASTTRKIAKTLNLGLAYGMGKRKLAEQLNKPYDEAMLIYDAYHEALPYIKELGTYVQNVAQQRGFIKTILGRHRHFDLYGPPKWTEGMSALPYDEAIAKYGRPVKQYYLHKALNSLIQGSSADMIKMAMINCAKAGHLPYLTIHDELDFCNITHCSQVREIKEIMLTSVPLNVPLVVDIELGDDWGDCTEITEEEWPDYLE